MSSLLAAGGAGIGGGGVQPAPVLISGSNSVTGEERGGGQHRVN